MGKTRRTLASLALLALATGSLSACEKGDGGLANAQASLNSLAHGLSIFDTSGVRFADADPKNVADELTSLTQGLKGVYPSVEARDVSINGDSATGTLDVAWPVPGKKWAYTVKVNLKRDGRDFLPVWDSTLLEPSLKKGEVLVMKTQRAARGDVLGQGDIPLVTSRPVLRVGLDLTHLNGARPQDSATRLAALLGIDAAPVVAQAKAAQAGAFVQALVIRAESDLAQKLTPAVLAAIPGAAALPDQQPLAPSRDFARPVLGVVGEATKEQIQNSQGELRVGDLAGSGGLQERYDKIMRGQDGFEIVARTPVDPKAPPALPADRDLYVSPSTPGKPLKTTLDSRIQSAAELVLADVKGPSAIVALKPSDGSILAAASGPDSAGYDTALQGQYAPGSIFKIIDSLALFREGANPGTKVNCSPDAVVNGKKFLNAPGYPAKSVGNVTLTDAFAHSCNTAFINQRDNVTQAELENAARSLGVGIPGQQLDFAGFMGSVPDSAEGTEHAANMIGQGQEVFSPLAAAVMAASTTGKTVTPHLLMPGALPSGFTQPSTGAGPTESADSAEDEPLTPAKAPSAAESKGLAELMRAVVTSGHAGYLQNVPGGPVGAKTGTAEYGNGTPPQTHSWIVGVQGDLAVAVFVEDGGVGAPVSGPLLQDFLTRIKG